MEKTRLKAIAVNLKRFRAELSWTQARLASESGVSPSSVKTLENETASNPRPRTLGALADALGRSMGELLTEPQRLERVRFRAKSSLKTFLRFNVVDSCARWLADYCFVEDLLGVPTEFKSPLRFKSGSDVREYAEKVRAELGVPADSPVSDVASVLAKSDLKLWFCPTRTNKDVFGLSINESPQSTAIVVFLEGVSTERAIFTSAHEFGHLLLHSRSFKTDISAEDKEEERQADEFASFFLMPRDLFLTRWNETVGKSFVERTLMVKRYFRVSYRTVLRRLIDEKIFDNNVYVRFPVEYKQITGKDLRDIKSRVR